MTLDFSFSECTSSPPPHPLPRGDNMGVSHCFNLTISPLDFLSSDLPPASAHTLVFVCKSIRQLPHSPENACPRRCIPVGTAKDWPGCDVVYGLRHTAPCLSSFTPSRICAASSLHVVKQQQAHRACHSLSPQHATEKGRPRQQKGSVSKHEMVKSKLQGAASGHGCWWVGVIWFARIGAGSVLGRCSGTSRPCRLFLSAG